MAQRTIPQLFQDSARKFGSNVFLWEKRGDRYEGLTYAELQTLVHSFAAGLMALGLKKGDRAALLSDARNDWVLREGWLWTGDVGYLDEDGFLYVLGRVKSLLIASDGEKFSPEEIEERIAEHSPYIEQLMLYNNQSPSTVGLLSPTGRGY